jgi:hypothetical protein
MEVSGQLHAPAALPIDYEAVSFLNSTTNASLPTYSYMDGKFRQFKLLYTRIWAENSDNFNYFTHKHNFNGECSLCAIMSFRS